MKNQSKVALVLLYVETCCGRAQGTATVRLIDGEGDMLNEIVGRTACATYGRYIRRGIPGHRFTCNGSGSWITRTQHDGYDNMTPQQDALLDYSTPAEVFV